MNIWAMGSDTTGFQTLNLENKDYLPLFFDNFRGNKITDEWPEIKIRVEDEGIEGDCPYFTMGVPIVSERALETLTNLISDDVQILPLIKDDKKWFALNVISVLPQFDFDAFKNGVIIGEQINELVTIIQEMHIFKIRKKLGVYVFVSDHFKELVTTSGLTGFRFERFWGNGA